MLKTRIIPTLLFKDFTLVKGISFDSWRRVGSIRQAIKVYNMRGVDELIFVDVTATLESRLPDFKMIDELADDCFVPLTVGGGIRSVEEIRRLLQVGADKVAIGTAAVQNPEIVSLGAQKFGSQCIVVSIDARRMAGGRHEVFTHSGKRTSGIEAAAFAKEIERLGAGEILLTSIDKDGTMKGYDIELIRKVTDIVSIPIIASGGAGGHEDILKALAEGRASAAAAASIFHFTEITPLSIKQFLREKGVKVRI